MAFPGECGGQIEGHPAGVRDSSEVRRSQSGSFMELDSFKNITKAVGAY